MLDKLFRNDSTNPYLSVTIECLKIAIHDFLKRPDNLEELVKLLENYRTNWIRDAFVKIED